MSDKEKQDVVVGAELTILALGMACTKFGCDGPTFISIVGEAMDLLHQAQDGDAKARDIALDIMDKFAQAVRFNETRPDCN